MNLKNIAEITLGVTGGIIASDLIKMAVNAIKFRKTKKELNKRLDKISEAIKQTLETK